jgi:hypothetical protein
MRLNNAVKPMEGEDMTALGSQCQTLGRTAGAILRVFYFALIILIRGIAPQASLGASSEHADAAFQSKVQEARACDPMWCQEEARNREKAVALYRQALAARPGDPRSIEAEGRWLLVRTGRHVVVTRR